MSERILPEASAALHGPALRVGVAGCASGRGRYEVALKTLPGIQIVALYDAEEREGRAWSRALPNKPPVFSNISALLEAVPELDAMLIAVSLAERGAILSAAAQAGKAMLCEAPFGFSLAETDRALQMAATQNALLMPVFPRCFDSHVQEMTRQAQEEELGTLRQARCEWSLPALGSAPLEGDTGDGWHALVQSVLCQAVTLFQGWLGEAQAVSADIQFRLQAGMRPTLGRSSESLATLLITYAQGNAACQINRVRATVPAERYMLYGSRGHLEWVADGGAAVPAEAPASLTRHRSGARPERIALPETPLLPAPILRMNRLLQHFADCVRGQSAPLRTGNDARLVQEVVHAAYLAAHEENKVSLPLSRSVDMNALLRSYL
jgi:predicted dehydrogenase